MACLAYIQCRIWNILIWLRFIIWMFDLFFLLEFILRNLRLAWWVNLLIKLLVQLFIDCLLLFLYFIDLIDDLLVWIISGRIFFLCIVTNIAILICLLRFGSWPWEVFGATILPSKKTKRILGLIKQIVSTYFLGLSLELTQILKLTWTETKVWHGWRPVCFLNRGLLC